MTLGWVDQRSTEPILESMECASKPTIAVAVTAFAVTLGTLGSISVRPAHAVFPGHNGKIAFNKQVGGSTEIYRASPNGSHQRRLTNNSANDFGPSVSPNGKKIVFVRDRDGNYEIYIMNADGSHQKRLTANPAADAFPSFSANGKKIVFISDRRHKPYRGTSVCCASNLFRMKTDGTHLRLLSRKDTWGRATWSPKGGEIVFVAQANHAQGGGFQLFSIRPDGTHVRLLTRGHGGHPGSFNNFSPDFSPNGKRIVVHRRTFPGGFHVWVMRADGSHRRRLTRRHNQVDPVFSPNGKMIAYTEYPSASGSEEIKVMRTDGSHRRKAIPVGSSPSWGVRP